MSNRGQRQSDVERFLQEKIDSVPHLEAVLLLWNTRPKLWSFDDLERRLFVPRGACGKIVEDLLREEVVAGNSAEGFAYAGEPDRDRILTDLDFAYRHELIRITQLIHSKPSSAVRAFARAFQFRKGES